MAGDPFRRSLARYLSGPVVRAEASVIADALSRPPGLQAFSRHFMVQFACSLAARNGFPVMRRPKTCHARGLSCNVLGRRRCENSSPAFKSRQPVGSPQIPWAFSAVIPALSRRIQGRLTTTEGVCKPGMSRGRNQPHWYCIRGVLGRASVYYFRHCYRRRSDDWLYLAVSTRLASRFRCIVP